ncbi:YecR family lipoprotein [Arenimonas metalli]|uniref:YecR family lipoprotein n=1 Tax=Arenimonas metalli TaxID=948077 RepID=UPI003CCBB7CD
MSSPALAEKQWLVTDASRSDAVVKLSYERNEFQRARPPQEQADHLATQICTGWGYTAAVQFGSEETTCLSRRGFGNCGRRRITLPYQCTGSPSN